MAPDRFGGFVLVLLAACGGSATLYEGSSGANGGMGPLANGGFNSVSGSTNGGAATVMGGASSVAGGGGPSSGAATGVAGVEGSMGGTDGLGGVPSSGGIGGAVLVAGSGGVGEAGEGGAPSVAGSGGQSLPCSATNCGAACPPCALGRKCSLDGDCQSNACDAVTRSCVADQCADHRQDGFETDADCGGPSCPTCVMGKMCLADSDCTVPACDGVSLSCVANPCSDHRRDFNETDIDCGGGDSCLRCKPGQACNNSTDCRPGHVCSTTSPKVCL